MKYIKYIGLILIGSLIISSFIFFVGYFSNKDVERCDSHWSSSNFEYKYNTSTNECLVHLNGIWFPEKVIYSYIRSDDFNKNNK